MLFLSIKIGPRITAVHADEPIEKQLEVRNGPVPIDRPDECPGVCTRETAVKIQVPKQVRLMIAMRSVAIAGPDAQRHGRRYAGVARLDLRPAVLITQVLKIDLPSERQTGGHPVHEGASLGIKSRTTV